MLTVFLEFLFWLQPGGGGGAAGAAPAGGGGGAPAAGGMSCAMQAGLMAVMMVVFYFLLIRPEQKRRREHEEQLKSIRKGTKVRTAGGILGEVVAMTDDEVILQIAKGVRVNVLRANIANIESARKAEADKDKDASVKDGEESEARDGA